MIENNLINQVLDVKERALAPYNGLDATWFDAWHPALDEALQSLPEMETCPHELFRLLIQNPGSAPKKTALVTRRGIPVAVIPLRQLGWKYYEVSTWMIPGAVFPAQSGYLIPALEALGSEVWVSWRRMGEPPAPSRLMRYQQVTPLHLIRFSNDYEQYWRESSLFKNIRKMRTRCKDFTLTVDSPGSAEWIITNAAEKWRHTPERTSRVLPDWAISDWIVVANYWGERKKHHALLLLDQGTPVGGATLLAHHNDAVGGLIYRRPEYEWYGIGVRLLDLCISFAAESGFDTLDFGGDADYKMRWAPQEGELLRFNLCPEYLFRAKRGMQWARAARSKLVNSLHKGQTQQN